MVQKEVDVLVQSSHLQVIVDVMIASGEWKVAVNWMEYDVSMINYITIRDLWLKPC
jgi:hypothetical protein